MCTILLHSGADFLSLRILGRTKPDATDYWDANWLHCIAEVSAGGVHAQVEWHLRNEDLERFKHALEKLDGTVGEALLDTLDDWLDVKIIQDEHGNAEATCHLSDGSQGREPFEFQLRLT